MRKLSSAVADWSLMLLCGLSQRALDGTSWRIDAPRGRPQSTIAHTTPQSHGSCISSYLLRKEERLAAGVAPSAECISSNRIFCPLTRPTCSGSSQRQAALPTPGQTCPESPTQSPRIRSDRVHRESTCRSDEWHVSSQSRHRATTPESS